MKATVLSWEEFNSKVADLSSNQWRFLGSKPALIDFFAPWCAPCRMLAPSIDELAEQYEGKVDIFKVNVDEQPEIAAAFQIRSIPTLLFIPLDGSPQIQQGALSKRNLADLIDRILIQ
jgi:thioredoxin